MRLPAEAQGAGVGGLPSPEGWSSRDSIAGPGESLELTVSWFHDRSVLAAVALVTDSLGPLWSSDNLFDI